MYTIHTLTEIKQAEIVWNQLSLNHSFYDLWSIRFAFWQQFPFQPRFYTATSNDQLVGLLPLQWNHEKNCLQYFGGGWFEDNHVFHHSEHPQAISALYNAINQPALLECVQQQDADHHPNFFLEEQKYTLTLTSYNNLEDYFLSKINSKKRTQLRKIIKFFDNQLVVNPGNADDLDFLFKYNIQRFGVESVFFDSRRQQVIKNFLNTNLNWQILRFTLNHQIQAVSLSVFYRNTYIYLNAGSNLSEVPNLGTYVILKNITQAINLKADIFDAGFEDLGWKQRFHLEPTPLYTLINAT